MHNILDLLLLGSHAAIKQEICAGAITIGFLLPKVELVWKPFQQYSEHIYINKSVTNQQTSTYLLYLESIREGATFFLA